jgi:hypothetical protein
MRLQEKNLVMAVELNDLIHVHENVLEPHICQFLIDLFESNPDKQERIDNQRRPNFTQFNLTENCKMTDEVENIHNYLIKIVLEHKKKYYEFVDSRCFPEQNNFEQFRIKKYNTDGNDAFDTHVDVSDYASARRFLSFMLYLNDVNEGGETIFDDLTIKPKTGTMIVFPPLWMYPHKGVAPISNTKYIMSTYLHYK